MSSREPRRLGRQWSSPEVQLDVRVTDALGTFIPDLTAATDRAGLWSHHRSILSDDLRYFEAAISSK